MIEVFWIFGFLITAIAASLIIVEVFRWGFNKEQKDELAQHVKYRGTEFDREDHPASAEYRHIKNRKKG